MDTFIAQVLNQTAPVEDKPSELAHPGLGSRSLFVPELLSSDESIIAHGPSATESQSSTFANSPFALKLSGCKEELDACAAHAGEAGRGMEGASCRFTRAAISSARYCPSTLGRSKVHGRPDHGELAMSGWGASEAAAMRAQQLRRALLSDQLEP